MLLPRPTAPWRPEPARRSQRRRRWFRTGARRHGREQHDARHALLLALALLASPDRRHLRAHHAGRWTTDRDDERCGASRIQERHRRELESAEVEIFISPQFTPPPDARGPAASCRRTSARLRRHQLGGRPCEIERAGDHALGEQVSRRRCRASSRADLAAASAGSLLVGGYFDQPLRHRLLGLEVRMAVAKKERLFKPGIGEYPHVS